MHLLKYPKKTWITVLNSNLRYYDWNFKDSSMSVLCCFSLAPALQWQQTGKQKQINNNNTEIIIIYNISTWEPCMKHFLDFAPTYAVEERHPGFREAWNSEMSICTSHAWKWIFLSKLMSLEWIPVAESFAYFTFTFWMVMIVSLPTNWIFLFFFFKQILNI